MIPAISPSQLDTWRSCKRKWAFTYIAGLPRPAPSVAQVRGIALHEKAELYIKTGELLYNGIDDNLLSAIAPHLPRNATAETKVETTIDGVLFAGRYDWLTDDGELGDLKTTSSLRWAKSAEDLAVHPQAIIYGTAVNVYPLRCRWLYVQTKGAATVREVTFTPDYSATDAIVSDAKEIVKAWTDKGDPNDYTPTLSACEQYGGCPFKAICKVDAGARLVMLMGGGSKDKDMNSFDALLAQINPPLGAPPPSAAVPTTVPEGPPLVLGTTPCEPAKAKRTRRTKAQIEADAAQIAADTAEIRAEAHDTDPPAASAAIGTLYVSCLPLGQDVDFADSIFAAARAKVAEQNGVEDYRLIQYGAGTGAFVAAVEALVRELHPVALVVDNRGPEANACLSALAAMSAVVVRAL